MNGNIRMRFFTISVDCSASFAGLHAIGLQRSQNIFGYTYPNIGSLYYLRP